MQGREKLRLSGTLLAAGGIYTAQSVIGGLTFMGIPTILRAEGVALDRIGLVSLAMLVWAIKFLWAPAVERFRRKPDGMRRSRQIILAGEAMTALLLLVMGLSGAGDFNTVLLLLITLAIVAATVDIACDAFIIEQLPPEKRGLGNIAQVGGGYLGMIFGSGLFVLLASSGNWLIACSAMAGLMVVMSLPALFVKERPVALSGHEDKVSLGHALRRPEILLGLGMVFVFEMGGRLAQGLAGPFLVDAGLSLEVIGILNGLGGVAAGLAGTLAGGLVVQYLGAKRALFTVAVLHVITLGILGAASIFEAAPMALAIVVIIEGGMMAAGFVALYSRVMGLVSMSQPGLDFTLFQCASAVTAAIFGMSGGMLAASAGYGGSFATSTILAMVAVIAIIIIERCLSKDNRP